MSERFRGELNNIAQQEKGEESFDQSIKEVIHDKSPVVPFHDDKAELQEVREQISGLFNEPERLGAREEKEINEDVEKLKKPTKPLTRVDKVAIWLTLGLTRFDSTRRSFDVERPANFEELLVEVAKDAEKSKIFNELVYSLRLGRTGSSTDFIEKISTSALPADLKSWLIANSDFQDSENDRMNKLLDDFGLTFDERGVAHGSRVRKVFGLLGGRGPSPTTLRRVPEGFVFYAHDNKRSNHNGYVIRSQKNVDFNICLVTYEDQEDLDDILSDKELGNSQSQRTDVHERQHLFFDILQREGAGQDDREFFARNEACALFVGGDSPRVAFGDISKALNQTDAYNEKLYSSIKHVWEKYYSRNAEDRKKAVGILQFTSLDHWGDL